MRLRNVKNANDIINNSNYIIKNPKDYINKWNKAFNNKNPIDIEIGMGKGDFIINMALLNPNINYIGIEKYSSVIARALQKLENYELSNVKLINIDAIEVDCIFNKEINSIYINFSDPWPKKRHEQRRLTSNLFLKKYDIIYKNKKTIFQKTDNIDFFNYSAQSLKNYGYILKDVSLNLYKNNKENIIKTEYETKFITENKPIFYLKGYKD